MRITQKHQIRASQTGMSLMELVVAMGVSMIAVSGMMMLTANTVGSSTEAIENARLSSELRSAMQIITRDLRRANFSETHLSCVGAGLVTCGAVPDTVSISGSCLTYSYGRNGSTVNGAIRLSNGALQMRTDASACGDSSSWQNMTDEGLVTITAFNITDTDGDELTYTQSLTSTLSQRIRKVRLVLTGRVCRATDGEGSCTDYAERTMSNIVRVRNDIILATTTS